MNYGDLISEAFRIVWRHKFLWFFGFFAAGAGGSFNVPSGGGGGDGGTVGPLPGDLGGLGRALQENLVTILVVAGTVVLLIVLFFIFMALLSEAALAESVAAIHRGEERRFGAAWRAGLRFFWRVLGLRIMLFLLAMAILLLIALVAGLPTLIVFVATESVGARVTVAVLMGLLAVLLLIAIFIPFAILGQWALRRAVVAGTGAVGSIGEGYRLLRRNLGRSLLVWLVQVGVMLGVGIAFLIVVVLVGLVLAIPVILLAVAEYATAAIAVGVVMFLIFLAIILPISGATGAFNHAYWTLAYLRVLELEGGTTEARAV